MISIQPFSLNYQDLSMLVGILKSEYKTQITYGKNNPKEFIVTLGKILGQQDGVKTLRGAGHLLKHLHFGFLITCPLNTHVPLTLYSHNLAITLLKEENNQQLILTSGTLQEWRNSIYDCCNLLSPKDIRIIMNGVLDVFYGIGLSLIFSDFLRRDLNDGTFILKKYE